MLPCFESFEACLVFVLVLHLGGVGVDGLPDEFGANLYLGCLLEGGRLQLAGVGERGFKELPVDEVAALKQGGERGLEDVLELLITQDRHLDRVRRAVFVVALPDHGFAGIGGMSSFRSVCVAAVGAIYFAGKAAFASATAARIEFGLGKLPRLWINDRVMRTSHIVLGHLALVDLLVLVRKSTVNVFCSRASPLYFSFVKMDWMVVWLQRFLPRGVSTPSASRAVAICGMLMPSKYWR